MREQRADFEDRVLTFMEQYRFENGKFVQPERAALHLPSPKSPLGIVVPKTVVKPGGPGSQDAKHLA